MRPSTLPRDDANSAEEDGASAQSPRLGIVNDMTDRVHPDDDRVCATGAEAVVAILHEFGVETAFAYPGTSELALCDAVSASPHLRLHNARGDKEAAFLAAGASLLQPNRAVAILHGARGATNAMGGIADARRTEAGTVFLVGMPSSASAKYLPPSPATRRGRPDRESGGLHRLGRRGSRIGD